MRTVFGLVMFFFLLNGSALAAVEANIVSARNSLEYTLTNLRSSVEQLTKENRELSAANDRLREQATAAQKELEALQRDDGRLLEQFTALEAKHRDKSQGVTEAERKVAALKAEEERLTQDMAGVAGQIAAKEQVEADLRGQVEAKESEVRAGMADPSQNAVADMSALQAVRDRLAEQVQASVDSLQRTREEWLDMQEVVQGGPGRLGDLKDNRNRLALTLEGKQADLAKLSEMIQSEQKMLDDISAPDKIGPAGLASLEKVVRVLNDKQLLLEKELRAKQQSSEKAHAGSLAEANEQQLKLEKKFNELSEKNKTLKLERDQLRHKMVGMDKKKSQLERSVYGDN
ncbi:MAG: hypothetical protein HGA80_08025 [Candidatus Omnitrophica bacterium]|nr:hypothetical protein [Candidatus Omnitrophota bacterium]